MTLPLGELFNISSTASTIDLKSLQRLVTPNAAPYVNNLTDVTVFAPSNEVITGKISNWERLFLRWHNCIFDRFDPRKDF